MVYTPKMVPPTQAAINATSRMRVNVQVRVFGLLCLSTSTAGPSVFGFRCDLGTLGCFAGLAGLVGFAGFPGFSEAAGVAGVGWVGFVPFVGRGFRTRGPFGAAGAASPGCWATFRTVRLVGRPAPAGCDEDDCDALVGRTAGFAFADFAPFAPFVGCCAAGVMRFGCRFRRISAGDSGSFSDSNWWLCLPIGSLLLLVAGQEISQAINSFR